MKQFTEFQKEILTELAKVTNRLIKTEKGSIATLQQARQKLTKDQKMMFDYIYNLDGAKYHARQSLINPKEVKVSLVEIKNQQYKHEDKLITISTRFLPKKVFDAYQKLNKNLYADTNKKLIVNYGYRGFGYQTLFICRFLANVYGFDLEKTLSRAVLPQYSQHCSSTHTGIDFLAYESKTTEKNIHAFARTVEYKWLKASAKNFDFYESFPKNNKSGMMYEPWHWQFRG
jgi:LAS superfamily LD-carboxypeptidase LdcB